MGTDTSNYVAPQSVDYTTYTGPATTLSGQEAAAQSGANDYRTGAQTNVANAYQTIQDYLTGTDGTTPLSVTAPTEVNTPGTPTFTGGAHTGVITPGNQLTNVGTQSLAPGSVDISNGGLLGYSGTLAQNEADAANQNEQAAYNAELSSLYNQLGPAEQQAYQSYNSAASAAPPVVGPQGIIRGTIQNPNYTTLAQLQGQVANTGAGQANVSNALDPNTVAMINALNQLAGNGFNNTVDTGTGQQAIGTGYVAPTPFDQAAALAKQQAAYNQYISGLPPT